MLNEEYWKSKKSDEALVLVKNVDPKELTSICTISPFKLKEEWLNYLVKLDNYEKEILIGQNCKLICGSTKDSTIKIFCEEDEDEFLSCFNIVNVNTHEKVEYNIKSIYSIIRQESMEELRYSLEDDSSLESLYKDIIIIINTENKLLSCKIPLHYILTLYIRSRIRRIREKLGNYQNSDISVSNIRKTLWIYQIENISGTNLISCYNINNVYPYILLISKDEEKEFKMNLCLISLNRMDFELNMEFEKTGNPLNIICYNSFILGDNSSYFEILENGIGFFPLKSSYIWVITTKKTVSERILENNDNNNELRLDKDIFDNNENEELKIEDLSESSSCCFYLFESNRSEIKHRGNMLCTNYDIEFFRILNLTCTNEGKDQTGIKEYIIRTVSSTKNPNGLFCFDFKLRINPNSSESDRMVILSLIFMPILEREVDRHIDNGDTRNYLNYSFGNNDGKSLNRSKNDEVSSFSRGYNNLRITTLCVIPNYILLLFGRNIENELRENFPLIFCGLSNGEWRTYSIKSSLKTRRSEIQDKINLSTDDIGFFVLKGVHLLRGDELSINNQLDGLNLSITPSCWSFDRNTKMSILSVAASNSIGNVFLWCLENERRQLPSKNILSKKKEITKEKNISFEISSKEIESKLSNIKNEQDKEKRGLISSNKVSKNKDILKTMDEHIRRIDERLRKVKIQEEIISDAERRREKVRKNKEKLKPRRKLTKEEAANFVPDCLSRSVSPRKGCNSCNYSDPDEKKPFFFKSKYDNFDHKRYRSYYKDNDHEYLFQLNNFLNIECIYKSKLFTEAGNNIKNPQIFNEIVDFDRLCSKWSKNISDDIHFDEILNE
ncbi:hypothetical protein [Cryptosporidium parvum Iowa II]|uniref:Uncharacterized protein n=2 Tax=Cryptosporidium parvum TaxID=5807 RepID=Q5CRF2_CRYPI|nr:hypothetical protein [Cryptosporidium parvum Iowa II]EAK88009.1 hypothetical protein cgd5_3020 [Cryptosporidium parvum Iowa II]QOY41734.1 Uncharacterized protein with WD40 repeat [Cryptosporidium parvum]WKS77957.1 hypothetical protein CPCDC_5g3020 [Cryptosporidium sp. 43IA8]WRK32447.1 WD40 repeat protein [Cryptosporidium parvum]|eukprot:QOY41734.1 hypothetical protein CPATCC_002327 [Cryptosporidium parvum]